MTTPSFPTRLVSRRALARISITDVPGLSSIHNGASARRPTPWLMRDQSSSRSWPLRTFLESTRDSVQRMRWLISSWLISNENSRTGRPASIATDVAMLSAKDVLPMAGRAPTMMRLLGCRPESSRSKSVKPVGVPVMGLPDSKRFSSWSRLASSRSRILDIVSATRP